ncbi:MAG TPA: phosphotransferase [Miltoncostaeaceae bacterium]|nr:phosphotransferase [Miltoncostaeaceae bacterium]
MTVAAPPLNRHRTGRRGLPERPAFVKAATGPAQRDDLLREAAVYGVVQDRCPATVPRLPRDVRWHAETDELVMEAVPAEDLHARVTAEGMFDPAVAAAVGRAVGEFHAEATDPGRDAPHSAWLRTGVVFARPEPALLRLLSGGGHKLLTALQRSEALRSRLSELAPPAGDRLTHGDLRWENILVASAPAPAVWLVDWEMGGAGEHAWDVGCVAAAAVSAWLGSIPHVPGVPPDRLAAEAAIPLDALTSGLNILWSSYRAVGPDSGSDAWTERCAQLAAARIVHLAFETTTYDLGLRPSAVLHLQVASNILDGPSRAGRDLLGLT